MTEVMRVANPEKIPLAEDGGIAGNGTHILVGRGKKPIVRNEWGGLGPLELMQLRRAERKQRTEREVSLFAIFEREEATA